MMHVYFWGTRGSLPASITAETVRAKVIKAIKKAGGHQFVNDEEIERFVNGELPFPIRGSYGNNTPCVEIKGGEEYIICDAGTGLRDLGNYHVKMQEQEKQNKNAVFNILISHFHWDHIQGFPFFGPAYVPGNQVKIYGFHKDIEDVFVRQQNNPYFPVPLKHMRSDIQFIVLTEGEEYEIGGFQVKGIKQNHPGISYGYRFEKDGKAIVYSSDAEHKTSWDQTARDDNYPFLEFFKEADLLIFDAQYEWLEAVQSKDDWGHSSYIAAVELGVKANVKHVCLFHNEPTYDDDRLEVLLEDTRNYLKIYNDHQYHPLKIDLAYDGMELEV
jgi:phosphoribosyl 1,2-cyclic phosphodiesterase